MDMKVSSKELILNTGGNNNTIKILIKSFLKKISQKNHIYLLL